MDKLMAAHENLVNTGEESDNKLLNHLNNVQEWC